MAVLVLTDRRLEGDWLLRDHQNRLYLVSGMSSLEKSLREGARDQVPERAPS